jgi:branched-subunit amino acid ABC-type transport system permease component
MLELVILEQIGWTSLATTSYSVLFAVAFALVLKINRLFNFTQAAAMNVGFYTVFAVVNWAGAPLWAGLAASLVTVTLFSVLIEVGGFAVLRAKRSSVLFVFIFTFMVSEFVAYLTMLTFGTWPTTIFQSLLWPVHIVGDIAVSDWDVPAIATALGCCLALGAFLRFTRWGQFMVAVSDNPDLAELYGIDKKRVFLLAVVIAGALCAVGMTLYGTRSQVQPMTSLELMLFATVATIVGGIGNIWGAAIAAVVLGFVQNASVLFIPSEFQGLLLYAFLFLAIIFFPQGLKLPERKRTFASATRQLGGGGGTAASVPRKAAE